MLSLLNQGHIGLFLIILFAIVFSLTFHEFGHAFTAKKLGDDTAEQMGRLTLNPVRHIDPMGLLLVVMVGFGYARPVPVNPRNLRYPWADAAVAAAGPAMNLLIAIVAANLAAAGVRYGIPALQGEAQSTLLIYLAQINVLLMLFNLIPLGPLDGHYVMEWLLPRNLSQRYHELNSQYGSYLFLVLIALSIMGVPIFRALIDMTRWVLPWIVFV
ncbi:MAG: site-2 protease family protein [Xanthomonadales bacterium]|nr:site-2 protease family protein [Xanthomonadales bacterium]